MKTVILVIGVPASGKSTVCRLVDKRFVNVPHDAFDESDYPDVLARARVAPPARAVIGEIPFGLSKIQDELEAKGLRVIPVFIYEEEPELRRRWEERGLTKDSTIRGHLKRQETYRERAHELGAFVGTAAEVLEHLQTLEP